MISKRKAIKLFIEDFNSIFDNTDRLDEIKKNLVFVKPTSTPKKSKKETRVKKPLDNSKGG